MTTADINEKPPVVSTSDILHIDEEQLRRINCIINPKKVTGASQGYYNRLASNAKDFNNILTYFPEGKRSLHLFILLMGYLSMKISIPEHRLDKSPTESSHQEHLLGSVEEIDYIPQNNYIDDQPTYSHNEIYSLAQKIGFPTKYDL